MKLEFRASEKQELPTAALPGTSLAEVRSKLVEKYQIKILGPTQVSLVLPPHQNVLTLLNDANICAGATFRERNVGAKDDLFKFLPEGSEGPEYIQTNLLLSFWIEETRFTKSSADPREIIVDGCVEGSVGLCVHDQIDKGWNNVLHEDLAAAHAAYYIATGGDLFNGHPVRSADHRLMAGKYNGLHEEDLICYGHPADNTVGSSRYIVAK